jgi:steroid delta-isomerase-like uncharacterized protein
MSDETHDIHDIRAIAHRFRAELWNTGDLSIVEQIVAADCLIHARVPFATDFARGPEALRQLVLFYHLAFGEIEVSVDQIVTEGDVVVVRWSAKALHTGDLLGIPATHRLALTSGIDLLRIKDGKIAEGWVSWDTLSLLEQILGPQSGEGEGTEFLNLLSKLQ